MSDELTPGRRYGDEHPGAAFDRSELATALRELAQDHETPAAVPGAEIRRRAVRRRRRRKAALAAAGTACAGALVLVLAVVLTGGGKPQPVPPAASYGPRTPSATAEPSPAAPAATVDLSRRELVARGRTLSISAGTVKTPTPTGLMTVTAKYETAVLPGEVAGWDKYQVKAAWVIRLRGPDDRTTYLVALDWDQKAPGLRDITGGAIGLREEDAKWLYQALTPGAVVEVVGATPTQPARKLTQSPTSPVESSSADSGASDPGASEPGATDSGSGLRKGASGGPDEVIRTPEPASGTTDPAATGGATKSGAVRR